MDVYDAVLWGVENIFWDYKTILRADAEFASVQVCKCASFERDGLVNRQAMFFSENFYWGFLEFLFSSDWFVGLGDDELNVKKRGVNQPLQNSCGKIVSAEENSFHKTYVPFVIPDKPHRSGA